ncbi:iron chelate uptake ABC transporter family permease subunit [Agrobacterium sp. AGB01]|uniref:iron chelate uptake ABC transporter family permease subunit n=1 Tax=Agrobacterium sp. AGB01 TaxID=2769302 RepID=UPI0017842E63|nr:iron chelate uptake ABC transporter family permease subunit [Agrobacterium sp. AGB01]MBD9390629.1 iron chelate uptake ABC transporter family permease subunit [Agrobacterium sp. AGB01]
MSATSPVAAGVEQDRRATATTKTVRWSVLVIGLIVLTSLCFASLLVGARAVPRATAMDALWFYDASSAEHTVIHDYRLPRTLLGLLCGAAFGVSGALIQAATRNPLADPGILGVNAGAAFFVTLAVGLFGFHSIDAYLWFAFAGAIIVTLAIYALGAAGRDGATPVRLVLSGVAIAAVLGGISSAITLLDPSAYDAMRMWSIGSIAGRDMGVVAAVAPFIGAGVLIALIAARPLNAVSMGDDLARSLGVNILQARILTLIAVTLLAGAGTAAGGPIGFVGLMVPHVVRWFVGPDQRWIIPLTMIYAPALLLSADIAGRLILYPGELEAGIVTAFIGAPVLILLARRRQASGL